MKRKITEYMYRMKIRFALMEATEEQLNITRQEIIREKNRRAEKRSKKK